MENKNLQNHPAAEAQPTPAAGSAAAPAAPQQNSVKKARLPVIIAIICAVLAAGIVTVLILLRPTFTYNKAEKLFHSGEYMSAIENYEKVLDKKDAAVKIKSAYYEYGRQLINEEKYTEAVDALKQSELEEAQPYITYANSILSLNDGNYDDAISGLKELDEFEQSQTFLAKAYYGKAEEEITNKDYESAKKYYSMSSGFDDIDSKIQNCDLMIAEATYQDGDLPKAQSLFEALPSDLTFNGVSVSNRLKTLNEKADIVALCGNWKGTGGNLSVRQTHNSTGLWDQWDATYTDYLTLKCVLKDDGTVTFKGQANFYVYTNYSSLSKNLNTLELDVDFAQTGTSIPRELYSDSTTKLTYDGNSFHLNYDYTNDNYSMNFKYRFKSSISYTR